MAEIPNVIENFITLVEAHNRELCDAIKLCEDKLISGTAEANLASAATAVTSEETAANLALLESEVNTTRERADLAEKKAGDRALELAEAVSKLEGDATLKKQLQAQVKSVTEAVATAQETNDQHEQVMEAIQKFEVDTCEQKQVYLIEQHRIMLQEIANALYAIKKCNMAGPDTQIGTDSYGAAFPVDLGQDAGIDTTGGAPKVKHSNVTQSFGGRRRSKKSKRKKSKNTRKRRKSRKSYR